MLFFFEVLFANFNRPIGSPSTVPEQLPLPIIDMIQASPSLRSLDLTVSTRFVWNATPWPSNSSPSSAQVFQDLRIYRVGGSVDPHWRSFFEAPETNEFHSFLRLHPHLHTVSISWIEQTVGHDNVSPEALADLFPSLRHFEGPLFLCEALVQSTLASRLETLGILDRQSRNERLSRVAARKPRLPELRTLKLTFHYGPVMRGISAPWTPHIWHEKPAFHVRMFRVISTTVHATHKVRFLGTFRSLDAESRCVESL